jgi:putative DNA methylase
MTLRPKLIEVALPLAAINAEAAREKSIRHGHPSTLHLWWARRPLAAARAVIWASLVDDPSGDPTLDAPAQDVERRRLFGILERLVKWESSNDVELLAEAKAEIDRCYPEGAPPVLDPFGGGGAIPLEAHRLGLKALSGDLNPVAILLQKAMIEVPPRFAGRSPVHPNAGSELGSWVRAAGLAVDIELYGQAMGDEAGRRIGHHYPNVLSASGGSLVPIAWIWARTVESPDPTWNGHVPLVASWVLANKKGKPKVWIEPSVDRDTQTIRYEVREGGEPSHPRTVDRGHGLCIATNATIPGDYIKSEGRAGRMGYQLLAVVAEGERGRVYVAPTDAQADAAIVGPAPWEPEGRNPEKLTGGTVFTYGLDEWRKLFSPRQLLALTTFSDLLEDIHGRVEGDARAAGWPSDGIRLRDGGQGATAYADAVVTYLAFAVDRLADRSSTLCSWDSGYVKIRNTFGRQAIPMTWDWAEGNPFSSSTGSWSGMVEWVRKAVEALPARMPAGESIQQDARARVQGSPGVVVSTDPPYYDNISYADLSDFFYVWLRRNLGSIWPDECATLLTPKADELIANRHRAGSKEAAERHFESGMANLMSDIAAAQSPSTPATIYYAYKATETRDGEVRSTGWDTFLQAVIDAGLQVTATWPMRTELANRLIASRTNALASSIVLACRPRPVTAPLASRGEFIGALREELPEAVRVLQSGNIAPVDIAQSTIGPGIKVFSRYAKVVEADGSAMPVADALTVINDVLAEVIDGEEAELDPDTRFAATWYAQHGYNPGRFGDADGQARAKNTSLAGIEAAGIGEARGGSFRLFERPELDPEWDATNDTRLTVWEATQHLVAALDRSETEAADLLHRLGGYGDRARQLAYVLFQKATDKGWAEEAGAYNGLILAWPTLQSMGSSTAHDQQQQLL